MKYIMAIASGFMKVFIPGLFLIVVGYVFSEMGKK